MPPIWIPFLAALALPVLGWLVLGLHALFAFQPLGEDHVRRLVATVFSLAFGAYVVGLGWLGLTGAPLPELPFGALVSLPRYHMSMGLHLDGLSLGLLGLTLSLSGLVGAFSVRYLHREPGFARFFFLLFMLTVGLELIAAGDGLDMLFAGWELVGLSSALLIAFFSRRRGPVEHGLRAYVIYRTVDVALLMAVVLAHHLVGSVRFEDIAAAAPAAGGLTTLVGALLVIGAMGKSGSVPFSGWVPRAMEGPTPSSAIFYGALSIHLGPFLLLRMWPVLEHAPAARVALVLIGLLTAAHGSMVGRVQHDIKGTLAYASVAQVGLMFAEIGLGWTSLATLHLFGHAVWRANQLLRAPSVLSERDELMAALGASRSARGLHIERLFPAKLRRALYSFALQRWYLDDVLDRFVVQPLLRGLRAIDGMDQRAAAATGGPLVALGQGESLALQLGELPALDGERGAAAGAPTRSTSGGVA